MHPFDPNWKLPVYVANFVLMDYGTGAIFGCPAHDQRDLDFVNKYGLGNTPVVCPPGQDPATFVITDVAYVGDGTMINSRFLDGMTIEQAKEEVAKRLEKRDARQPAGGAAPGQLPPARLGHFAPALLGLPDPDHPLRELRRRAGAGKRSAGHAAGRRHLRQAGQSARPPSDLEACHVPAMRQARRGARPTPWTPSSISSWYFARFTDPWNETRRPTPQGRRSTGCRSTNISAASSTRSCICSIRASSPARCTRPAMSAWTSRSPACSRKAWWCTRPTAPRTATGSSRPRSRSKATGDARRAVLAATGEPIEIGAIEKMSKSKKNTVDPDDIIAAYGADTARWFMLSDSPPERDVIWTEEGVQGAWRFVQRLWRLIGEIAGDRGAGGAARAIRRAGAGRAQGGAPRARQCVGGHRPAALQPLRRAHLRMRQRASATPSARAETAPAPDLAWALREAGDILVRLFHPMMPHLAEECWAALGHKTLVATEAWPQLEPACWSRTTITLPVQVNGKKRADVTVARDAGKAEIEAAVLALDAVKKALDGKSPKKVIVVPQRIVNVVA